jgi:hypothetical protein
MADTTNYGWAKPTVDADEDAWGDIVNTTLDDIDADLKPGAHRATATNDSAPAGRVGEYIESEVLVGSAVALTSTVAANITSISLTAGDWDVWGTVAFSLTGATQTAAPGGWISTTSATAPAIPNKGAIAQFFPQQINGQATWPVGMRRLSLASTTTVYLSASDGFSAGSVSAYGFIGARRAR